jgi:hypothetical protein
MIDILKFCSASLLSVLFFIPNTVADVYELRTYTTNEGKLDALNARFRDHTVKLFEKHGIKSVGYWIPTNGEKSKNTLIYVLQHDSREAAAASFKAFRADPAWRKAARESQKAGKILAKRPESVFMELAEYSPSLQKSEGDNDDVFELRIYKAAEGKLDKLDARFRDHTIKIFASHGMESVAYWHPIDKPDSLDTLIYILKYNNQEAVKAAWKGFGSDPAWKKAAKESGVGRLAKAPESIYMKATDYSAIR